jgi:uncharacterized protein (DUF433 family)
MKAVERNLDGLFLFDVERYAIFENLEAGANLDDIMKWYDGLDREQVKAVIEFAARGLDKASAFAP